MDFLCFAQPHKPIILLSVYNSEKNDCSMGNPRVAAAALELSGRCQIVTIFNIWYSLWTERLVIVKITL